jgi:hypothetical protein
MNEELTAAAGSMITGEDKDTSTGVLAVTESPDADKEGAFGAKVEASTVDEDVNSGVCESEDCTGGNIKSDVAVGDDANPDCCARARKVAARFNSARSSDGVRSRCFNTRFSLA